MRSKNAFMQTIIQLMKSNAYEKITVSQLCKSCNYSRSAFYHLFIDKEDLLQYTIEHKVKEIADALSHANEDPLSTKMINANKVLMKNKAFLRLFLKDNKIKGFRANLFTLFYKRLVDSPTLEIKNLSSSIEIERKLANIYFTSTICGVLFEWIQGDNNITPEQLRDIIIQLKNPSNHDLLIGHLPFHKIKLYDADPYKDNRIIRTEKAFNNALISLLSQKPYAKIRVNDIIAVSGYNKSTFYKYYDSIDTLLENSIDYFLRNLFLSMSTASNEPHDTVLFRLFEHFYQQRNDFVKFIFFSDTPGLYSKIYSKLCKYLRNEVLNHINVPATFYVHYITSSILCFIRVWLSKYPEYTPQQISTIYTDLLKKDLFTEYYLQEKVVMT